MAAYAYDLKGHLTALTHRDASGAVVEPLAYTYDAVGNRTTRTDYQGSAAYTYDALARLVEARTPVPTAPVEAFTYDPVGNRLHSTQNGASVFNAGHQLLEDAHFTYQYDAAGNRTRQTAKADGAVTTYTYDAEHQLTQVVMSTGLTVAYTYDVFGRRLTKTVTDHGTTTVTRYVYDGADVLAALDESGAMVARYTHGPGIDEPLLLAQDGQTYAYHADGLGSITALTDGTGAVVQRYTYTAFGMPASPGEADVAQPYTFTGREWDAETGLYYYRARYYDPVVGRFISSDPLGLEGGMNTYAYVDGNPLTRTDPTGLFFDSAGPVVGQAARICGAAASAAAAAAVAGVAVVLWPTATAECDVITPPEGSNCGNDEPHCSMASRYQLARAGITNAHEFKEEYVGRRVSRYDICACKDGSIKIAEHGQCGKSGPKIDTWARWK